ncbi:hypothetical protein CQY20_01445 [Mycolicibacterium agri]|uniref:DUF4286 domain-containing protein n=1 Tax=Mycolicibacterium agri TaxID=36811 RepID=A0A2A7NFR0_MYCAG|nr:DUF4286 family protein [Mycolicibacterium agri]PEG42689.1 hypothetical protein CQY20_01445 [Mycolicibacterium agri]GFG52667.1 hypothetical protein MAGR_41080 [Mycolicibacterium agri]
MSTGRGSGLLFVMIDIEPEFEDEFNRWYEEEHLPERLACDGFLNGRRFQALEGGPKYLATYELENPEVLDGPAYQRLLPPTEWTRKISAHFTDHLRNVYREITPAPMKKPDA